MYTQLYIYDFDIVFIYQNEKIGKIYRFFFLLECRNQYGSYFLFRPGLGHTEPGVPTL